MIPSLGAHVALSPHLNMYIIHFISGNALNFLFGAPTSIDLLAAHVSPLVRAITSQFLVVKVHPAIFTSQVNAIFVPASTIGQ
jgi:hypothetical protein